MSGKSGAWVAVSVCLLGAKLLLFSARHSSTPRYDSFGSSYGSKYDPYKYNDPYKLKDPYAALPKPDYEGAYAKLEARKAVKDLQEKSVDRYCRGKQTVFLEPQGTQVALFRSSRRSMAPTDVIIPEPWTVMGLPVLAVTKKQDGTTAACTDADDALVMAVAVTHEGPAAEALKVVGPGAWTVTTTSSDPVPAATALMSQRFLSKLNPKGALIAFAPTDHQVAFADASSPAAVRLAARTLAPTIDITGDSGLAFARPLILEGGKWKPWTPTFKSPELSAVAMRSVEVTASGAVAILDDLAAVNEPDLKGLLAHSPTLTDASVTERSWDETAGATVELVPDSLDGQWVARAQKVRVGTTVITWERFVAAAGKKLTPMTADGQSVPDVFLLEAGFDLPASKQVAHLTP